MSNRPRRLRRQPVTQSGQSVTDGVRSNGNGYGPTIKDFADHYGVRTDDMIHLVRHLQQRKKPTIVPPFMDRKLVIGIPLYWTVPYQFLSCLGDLLMPPGTEIMSGGADAHVIATSIPYIDIARNDIVARAAKAGADWILWLDQDMVFPPDLYVKLARHDVDIVGGLYHKKVHPHEPLIFDWCEDVRDDGTVSPVCVHRFDYEEGLIECGAVGMGATLIKMDVYPRICQVQSDFGSNNPAPYRVAHPIGEDIFMSAQARMAGIKVHIDTSIKLGHVGLETFTETDYKLSRYGTKEQILARLQASPEPVPELDITASREIRILEAIKGAHD